MANNRDLYVKGTTTGSGGTDITPVNSLMLPSYMTTSGGAGTPNIIINVPMNDRYMMQKKGPISLSDGKHPDIIFEPVQQRIIKTKDTQEPSFVYFYYSEDNGENWSEAVLTNASASTLTTSKLYRAKYNTNSIFLCANLSVGCIFRTSGLLSAITKITTPTGLWYDMCSYDISTTYAIGMNSTTRKLIRIDQDGTVLDSSTYMSSTIPNTTLLRCIACNTGDSNNTRRIVVGGQGALSGTALQCLAYGSATSGSFAYCTTSDTLVAGTYKVASLKNYYSVSTGNYFVAHIYNTFGVSPSYIMLSDDGIDFKVIQTMNNKYCSSSTITLNDGEGLTIGNISGPDFYVITSYGSYGINILATGIDDTIVTSYPNISATNLNPNNPGFNFNSCAYLASLEP